jgi:hypothetical protein
VPAKSANREAVPDHRATKDATLAFSGHETFVFRYGWLKKAVDAISQRADALSSDEAMVTLGVGKNMVRSVRHWGLATQVLQETPGTRGSDLSCTSLGTMLLGPDGFDPYLEDISSLWLLHWKLVTTERRSTTWSWAFNLLTDNEFTRDSLSSLIREELQRRGAKLPSDNSLTRDIDCFIRTYAAPRDKQASVLEDTLDCPLVELQLVEEDVAPGLFYFKRGEQTTLADQVFLYALLDFWERTAPRQETLSFAEIAYRFGSPGCVFKLDENSVAERLERVERLTRGSLSYAETAGLRQLYRHRSVDSSIVLKSLYERVEASVLGGA